MNIAPSYLGGCSPAVQHKYSSIYNHVLNKESPEMAAVVAGTLVKECIRKEEILARNLDKRSIISFTLDEEAFLSRDEQGNEYLTFTLANDKMHKDGKRFTEKFLKKMADSINQEGGIGDIDHKTYYGVLDSSVPNSVAKSLIKAKKGIAKAVSAFVENGKLFIRTIIDKRYRNYVKDKSRGLSLEAFYAGKNLNTSKVIDDGEFLGFTFNVDTEPALYGTGL